MAIFTGRSFVPNIGFMDAILIKKSWYKDGGDFFETAV